ncbi:MAG: hypothetical protein RIS76_3397 [Verrucomicrobiota bacterium]|jgi:hypothetical protein
MTAPRWLETTGVTAEIRTGSFHARSGDRGVDLPVERNAEGRLTAESGARIVAAIRTLVSGKSWASRLRIVCAIGARGLILRPLPLPVASPKETVRLLQLQIESEFPLPPEELAWGWIPWTLTPESAASPARQTVLVAAVKKEVVEELTSLLKPLAAELIFTPAALARTALVPHDVPSFALLEIGWTQSELIVWEEGSAPSLRLPAFGETQWADAESDHLQGWASLLPTVATRWPLWISRPSLPSSTAAAPLPAEYGAGRTPMRTLAVPAGPGYTAAIAGMIQSRDAGSATLPERIGESTSPRRPLPLLGLQSQRSDAPDHPAHQLPTRPVILAVALLMAVLLLPYLEAFLLQPRLARRLAALKSQSTNLATIDRQMGFLRYLEQNQAPHLDAVFMIAQAAPQGVKVESINMNRQGEVALSGWLRDLNQVGEFRLKLINSGFFSSVVVEDQSPTPDRQRINFRINARWRDAGEREALKLDPDLPDSAPPKSGGTNVAAPASRPPPPPPLSLPASP